jgi:hypothetical protein
MVRTLHFSGWNAINHDVSHFSSLSRSDWSISQSDDGGRPTEEEWLKSRPSDVRWIFMSNLSDGDPVGIFKCDSRKEYLQWG